MKTRGSSKECLRFIAVRLSGRRIQDLSSWGIKGCQVSSRCLVNVTVERPYLRIWIVARESRWYYRTVAQVRTRTVTIIGLNRFPLALCDANRVAVCGTAMLKSATVPAGPWRSTVPLRSTFSATSTDRVIHRFRRDGEAVCPFIDIGEIDHQLHVVHPKWMLLPMRLVTMENLGEVRHYKLPCGARQISPKQTGPPMKNSIAGKILGWRRS